MTIVLIVGVVLLAFLTLNVGLSFAQHQPSIESWMRLQFSAMCVVAFVIVVELLIFLGWVRQ